MLIALELECSHYYCSGQHSCSGGGGWMYISENTRTKTKHNRQSKTGASPSNPRAEFSC